MSDLTATTTIVGSNHEVALAWLTTPQPMVVPVSTLVTPTGQQSYVQRVRAGERYPVEASQTNTFLGFRTTPGLYAQTIAIRYTGASSFEWLRFPAHDDYFSYGRVSGDATFNSWYLTPPTIYGKGTTAIANKESKFFGLPAVIPAGWTLAFSPNLHGERRITAPGRRQLVWLEDTSNGTIFLSPDDGKLFLAMTITRHSTLHGLPATIHANDSVNGFAGDTVSFAWRWRFFTIDQTNGAQQNTFSATIATSGGTFTPNIWRIRGPVAVMQPAVPANAYAYDLQREATVNGAPQGWVQSNAWHPFAPCHSQYDIMDPTTGAWLPAALFEIG